MAVLSDSTFRSRLSARFILAVLLIAPMPGLAGFDPCVDNAVLGITPLMDMGSAATYQGFSGGLYPGGNMPPPTHRAAALARAASIKPLNASGVADPQNGRVVLLAIGMSNTTQEFRNFVGLAATDARRDSHVLTVDGAEGGRPANDWADPASSAWSNAIAYLQAPARGGAAGILPAQVQVMWMKHAYSGPQNLPGSAGQFPGHALQLKADLAAIARTALALFPNLKLLFVTSRTRAYVLHMPPQQTSLNPEPYAFESGFSAKWLIEDQINGDPSLNYDPQSGAVVAPLLVWGPYIWADGTQPRLDGFTWLCSDTRSPPDPNTDYTHPSLQGQAKIGAVLLDFFANHELARPWFVGAIFTNGFDAGSFSAAAPADR